MNEIRKAIELLRTDIESKEKNTILSFDEFLEATRDNPQKILRSIFQKLHDMGKSYIGEGEDEYPDDPENIGFVKYDCSRIFVHGSNKPFFADRLFANRFVRQVESLRQGSQQNRVYVYEGPHGCGKSTFMDNLLRAFEEFVHTEEGQGFELFWEIEAEEEKVKVPCPSHDHPILLIPKKYRVDFLDNLLSKGVTEFKHRLSHDKEYEWVFEGEVCTICKSLFGALLDKLGSFDKVLSMAKVRPYKFDRRLGEGISIFNPGDKPMKEIALTDKQIQGRLDKIFGANLVKYVFSLHAKTNNGIYVLMDIKSYNMERLMELHNIISEGVHKVNGIIEERISSLFLALMNPEDKESVVKEERAESFQGRIRYNKIHYILDVPTEVATYRSTFGERTGLHFLPRVLENFARVIISSRMNAECAPLKEWIPDASKYRRYCDEAGLLLRMEIYGGIIPQWLSEEDKKKLTAAIRRRLIAEGEREGEKGFSGRESIDLFGEFLRRYGGKPNLINMGNVSDFFKHGVGREKRNENIPKNFIDSLLGWYNYLVLNEIKESLYFYNNNQISEDVLHYIYATNYDVGSRVRCEWTGQELEVTIGFLKLMSSHFIGKEVNDKDALNLARNIQKRYVETIARERNENIAESELYQELFTSYVKGLKERTFRPFLKNNSFKEAVKSFGTEGFNIFDTRLKEHVSHMIKNLVEKFGYTEQGAKEICLYAVDEKLVDKFS